MDIPAEYESEVAKVRDMLFEAVAETSEELMEKYFGGEEFTPKEIISGVRKGVDDCSLVPVLFGSATHNIGVKRLLDTCVELFPAPNEIAQRQTFKAGTDEEIALKCDEKEPPVLFVFKTLVDPYIGKLSYFKVLSGTITPDIQLYNVRKEEAEKIGRLHLGGE